MSASSGLRCLALVFLTAPAAAMATPPDDPAPYLQAFNETCRRGFPDLDVIARHAAAQGWVESAVRPTDGAAGVFATLPRILHKGGTMLVLTRPDGGASSAVCQIAGSAATRLSGAEVAALMTPSLKAGAPIPGPGDPTADDHFRWTVAPGITVDAGISVHARKTRTISIIVRQARGTALPVPPPGHAARPTALSTLAVPAASVPAASLAGGAFSSTFGRLATRYRKANLFGGYSDAEIEPGLWRVRARSNGPAGVGFARNMAAYRAAEILQQRGFSTMQIVNQRGQATTTRSGGSEQQIGETMTLWVSGVAPDAVPAPCRAKATTACFTLPIAQTLERIRPLLAFPVDGS